MSDESATQTATTTITLDEKDMPPLFHDADQRAIKAQKRFFGWLRWELLLLGLGVLVGAFNGITTSIGPISLLVPPFTVFGFHITTLSAFEITEATLLAIALVMRLMRIITRPEQLWYEARAVAESVKSIAWRYAVGGEPFQKASTDQELSATLKDRTSGMQEDLTKYKIPASVSAQDQVTPAMTDVRQLSLDARKQVYRKKRVEDQQGWYDCKTTFNKNRANLSHGILITVEFLAVIAALLPIALAALHLFPINLQSLAANIAGSGAAWMQAKRYEDLNASYRVTAKELKKVASGIDHQHDEAAWARFVENVEGSMSREHQLWCAVSIN